METPTIVYDKFGNYERVVEDIRYFHVRCGLVKLCINSYIHENPESVESLNQELIIQELSKIFQSNLNFCCSITFSGIKTSWINFVIEIENGIEPILLDVSFQSIKEYFNDSTSN